VSQSNNAPFFIIGSERSGTTLLMVMLGQHPRLAVPEVSWYYPRFRKYLHTYGNLSKPANFRALAEEMIFGLKTPFFGLSPNPRTVVDEILARVKSQTFGGLFDAILGWYADSQNKPRWGEKTPHNLYFVREILADFPNAQFVHLTRDGRDVASEQLDSAFGPTNVYAAAKIWKQTIRTAADLRASVPSRQWFDISYETLVSRPEESLRKITEFLGEEFTPALLDFHKGEIAQRRAQTKDHRPLGDPVSAKHIGKYKRHLSLRDQQIFAGIAGAELKESGYEVEVAPLALSAKEAALYEEWDLRVRASTLDAPEGHLVYESYNDWLADRREERRKAGVWSGAALPAGLEAWHDEFISGQRAPSYWKNRFAIKRTYSASELVL
jgi:hypothetical protein